MVMRDGPARLLRPAAAAKTDACDEEDEQTDACDEEDEQTGACDAEDHGESGATTKTLGTDDTPSMIL